MTVKLTHGGDVTGFKMEYGYEPLDFSANVSPLGVPDSVVKAITTSALMADKYPDPLCRELSQKIAEYEGVSPDNVLCGNGAADLIFRLAYAVRGKRAVVTAPTFSEYEAALDLTGCEVERYYLMEENDFRTDDGFIDTIKDGIGVVFLCEPNNPTGLTSGRDFLERVLARCEEYDALLVVDECFNEFIDDPGAVTMKEALLESEHILILKAFTKVFAMAGVRLGYCLTSNRTLIDEMRGAGQPWAVSGLAQAAGIAALGEPEYVTRLSELVRTERPFLEDSLREMGFRVISGEANYVLFQGEEALGVELMKKGILIRDCSNYPGLGKGWFRVAVRERADNEKLIDLMREVLDK